MKALQSNVNICYSPQPAAPQLLAGLVHENGQPLITHSVRNHSLSVTISFSLQASSYQLGQATWRVGSKVYICMKRFWLKSCRLWALFLYSVYKKRDIGPKSNICLWCCGSGRFIPDPRSWFLPIRDPQNLRSRIPDPKTATKERVLKKFVVISFFVATNFTKLKNILFLKCWRKNFGAIF